MNQNKMREALDILRRKPVKEFDPYAQVVDGRVKCLCGKKFIGPEELSVIRTSVSVPPMTVDVEAANTCCLECRHELEGQCPVVCMKCRQLIAYMKPGREANGFTRVKGKVYHAFRCPFCDEEMMQRAIDGKPEVQLVEKMIYMKNFGPKIISYGR